ncbi:hypothetical protein [Clostridium guangxiense]|uniref:hypothetical protein n=1 Tax=Clostridium guangxiense TaxID=1662055 RepID=UPI001E35F33F|nr:hypothetical protein [Clostridium guangxiense]MCD2348008.1 hypothetical protein [Clostridium guangxiense]
MIFLQICTFIAVLLIEVPDLVKNKYWHELKIFSIFLAAAFILSLFYIIDIPIPNPVRGIEYLIKDILHLNYD